MPPTLKACAPLPYPMAPSMTRVTRFIRESAEVFTFDLAPERVTPFTPGQFNMLYAFGVGEIPGVGWPVEEAKGFDVLLIGGGIGLAPLRPAIYWLLRHRAAYGRVGVLYGARTPDDLIFVSELEEWRKTPDFQLRVAVERAGPDWTGDVGYVTPLLSKLRYDPADAIAMICGPEVMIRATALALEDAGIADSRIFVSMERNMKCAIGHCGHCQFGPLFICKDGPVHRYDRVRDLLAYREL
ncbi:MAG: oxidoreductase FAD/NAD(P)-binding domain-containing protein [Methylocystaceae bacterium]|nr:MAG: oxidoreductase FAD/NAD(P)-binding domain-containing protein [Methylocystaceae bacterium]